MITIISLGGSLIAKEEVDIAYLTSLKTMLEGFLTQGRKFAVYCGGGATARNYIKAASSFGATDVDKDWVGTMATRLNAELVRAVFAKQAHPTVAYNPTRKIVLKKNILVCAGWKPGWSTDYDAVLLAKNLGSKLIINATNVDYVYDKDPWRHKDAKPYPFMSWTEFRKLVGDKWKPGMNAPFDPVAAKEAESQKAKVIILNGSNLDNLKQCLSGGKFKGTVIS